MRFLIKLEVNNTGNALIPINYQYELSSWIYKQVNSGDNVFAAWLHSQGYNSGIKHFKLFVFSMLNIPQRNIENEYIRIQCPEVSFSISFLLDEIAEPFVYGLFKNQAFTLGDKVHKAAFTIKSIERLPEPAFTEKLMFRAISPIVISTVPEGGNKYATYISPEHPHFEELFFQNIINKIVAATSNSKDGFQLMPEANLSFSLQSKIATKLIKIKSDTAQQTFIRGFMFDFQLEAPVAVMRAFYHAGCGEKNSMGFGCVEVMEQGSYSDIKKSN